MTEETEIIAAEASWRGARVPFFLQSDLAAWQTVWKRTLWIACV